MMTRIERARMLREVAADIDALIAAESEIEQLRRVIKGHCAAWTTFAQNTNLPEELRRTANENARYTADDTKEQAGT